MGMFFSNLHIKKTDSFTINELSAMMIAEMQAKGYTRVLFLGSVCFIGHADMYKTFKSESKNKPNRKYLIFTIKTVYSNGTDRLTLRQSVKKEYKADIDTENNEAHPVYVGDYLGFLIEYDGYSFLEWETDLYVFSLNGCFGKAELISIAETVK